MKSKWSVFFAVALLSELATSWFQSHFLAGTTLDLHRGDTYLVVGREPIRLLIWIPTFILLSGVGWFLLWLGPRKP
jgi:hypothetical protein